MIKPMMNNAQWYTRLTSVESSAPIVVLSRVESQAKNVLEKKKKKKMMKKKKKKIKKKNKTWLLLLLLLLTLLRVVGD